MRSPQKETREAPEFLNEKDARKQAERQAMLDAMAGTLEAAAIDWNAAAAPSPHSLEPGPDAESRTTDGQ